MSSLASREYDLCESTTLYKSWEVSNQVSSLASRELPHCQGKTLRSTVSNQVSSLASREFKEMLAESQS